MVLSLTSPGPEPFLHMAMEWIPIATVITNIVTYRGALYQPEAGLDGTQS